MNKILKIFVIIAVALIAGVIAFNNGKENTSDNYGEQLNYGRGKNNIECLYYNPVDFVNIKEFELNNGAGSVRGCILPHHLIAKDLIHEVFQNVGSDYETVVLIGPDHESIHMGKVFTTLKDWQTPMGLLKTDENLTKELLKNNFVVENDEKLTVEHSTSSIIPFIKYYLKDVNVVTLALTKQVKLKDVDKLIEDLYKSVDKEKTLFIASVDFSHYLDLESANAMDIISMQAIKNKDINKIMSFTNDNLDSPVSIVTMIKMMDKLNAGNLQVLNHSNLELILEDRVDETTSYITFLFR